jgi:uncharacterized membrane protein YqhA
MTPEETRHLLITACIVLIFLFTIFTLARAETLYEAAYHLATTNCDQLFRHEIILNVTP